MITTEQYIKNLQVPKGRVDVVLDTDTFNEVDDQFALSYLLYSDHKLNTKALYAAPFADHPEDDPKEGMLKSYDEIFRILKLAGREEYGAVTFQGSEGFLKDEKTPRISDAANHLIALASGYSPESPLYVIAIGAITNVASALLMKPEIADSIVVVWLGGHSREWNDAMEFNMYQDVAAARVLFQSGVPIVQIPCCGVTTDFIVGLPELEYYLGGKTPLCDFLVDRVKDHMREQLGKRTVSRILCDVNAVAWLLNDKSRFMLSRLASLPVPEYDNRCAYDHSRLIQYVYAINRDELLTDMCLKLSEGKCFDGH